MNNFVKWILVAPVAIAATVATWLALTFAWHLSSSINIVPQNDFISLALANFGINALATFVGIVAGAHVAPSEQQRTTIVLAGALILFATITLFVGAQFRSLVSMSMGWHIWSTLGWIAGSVGAVAQTRKVPVSADS